MMEETLYLILIIGSLLEPTQTGDCNAALGLETGAVHDNQFSASSSYAEYGPHEARLNNGGVGWVPDLYGTSQYLKLDLNGTWNITGFAVQGVSKYVWYTSKLRITFSDDELVWYPYNSYLSDDLFGEIVLANEDENQVKKIDLQPSIRARFLVFNPDYYLRRSALKLEVYGCLLRNGSEIKPSYITEDIEDNQVWGTSQSPIVISSEINVRPSGNLTVEADVSVIFTELDAGLSVSGRISAVGAKGRPILFSSNHPVLKERMLWFGIRKSNNGRVLLDGVLLRQAKSGIYGDGMNVSIKRVTVSSCQYGIRLYSGHTTNDTAIISESEVLLNERGIELHGTSTAPYINIYNTDILNSTHNGVTVLRLNHRINYNSAETILRLDNCKLNGNFKHGLDLSERIPGHVIIHNCSVSYNSKLGINYYRKANHGLPMNIAIRLSAFIGNGQGILGNGNLDVPFNFVLEKSNFISNLYYAVQMQWNVYSDDIFLRINGNVFKEPNSVNLYPFDLRSSGKKIWLEFINNTCVNSHGCVRLYSGNTKIDGLFSYNKFESVYGAHSVILATNIILNFTRNTVENTSTSTILEITGGFDHVVTYNNFGSSNNVSCLLKYGTAFDINTVLLAPRNYWGSNTLLNIKQKICDFFLNSEKARVRVVSYFPSSDMKNDTLKLVEAEDQFNCFPLSEDTSISCGGILAESQSFTGQEVAGMLINRSILIMDTAELGLGERAAYFAENRGIVVQGALQIGSNDDVSNHTVLKSTEEGTYWNGFTLQDGHISVSNTDINDVKNVITVASYGSAEVRHTIIERTNKLLNAKTLNGNLSLLVEFSIMDLNHACIDVELNDSQPVYVTLRNTSIISRSNTDVIMVSDMRGLRGKVTQVSLDIYRSNIMGRYGKIVHVSSCLVHLYFSAFQSTFSGSNDIVYTHIQSTTVNVSYSSFDNGNKGFYFQFCERVTEVNFNRNIDIRNSILKNAIDIYYYNLNVNDHYHTFVITNNVFKQRNINNNDGVKIYTRNSYHAGNMYLIQSNIFEGKYTAIDLYGNANMLDVSCNTFIGGGHALKVYTKRWLFHVVNISSNIIKYNHADGIMRLEYDLTEMELKTYITGNDFENNTGSIVCTNTPYVFIQNNYFNTHEAHYNLKVSKETSAEFKNLVLNASINFWGSTDINVISKQIYDKSFDEDLFDVIFQPYLGSKNISDIRNEDPPFMNVIGEIGGKVTGKIILSNDMSPYLVVGNIEIGDGVLILNAGVTLLFKENLGISIFGSLKVLGNMTHPVHLISEMPSQKWRGLAFLQNRGDGRSILRHVIVNNTLNGVIVNGNVTEMNNIVSNFSENHGIVFIMTKGNTSFHMTDIENITAAHNMRSGIVVKMEGKAIENVRFQLRSCIVSHNTEHGLRIESNATVIIERCRIIDNGYTGVSLGQDNGGRTHLLSSLLSRNQIHALASDSSEEILMENCHVNYHNFGRYDYWSRWISNHFVKIQRSRQADMNVTIRRNVFTYNVADGIRLHIRSGSSGTLVFLMEDNIFYIGNRTLSIYNDQYFSDVYVKIRNNTFENIIDSVNQVIDLDLKKVALLSMADNTITKCTTPTILHITGGKYATTSGPISIINNTFYNNMVQTTISVDVHLDGVMIAVNVFDNHDSECELKGPEYLTAFSINAKHNFWGKSNVEDIVGKVCGFEKDMRIAFIYYVPYFTDENLQTLIAHQQDDFSIEDTLGGEVTGELVLSRSNSPFIITRSFLLRENTKLSVEAGTMLEFANNRGIYAYGSLVLEGRQNAEIQLQGANGSRWHGLIINSTMEVPSLLKFVHIIKTRIGVVTHDQFFDIWKCNISNSLSNGIILNVNNGNGIYNFGGTSIEDTDKDGIVINGNGNITIENVTIQRAWCRGLALRANHGHLIIAQSTIRSCSKAMQVYFLEYETAGNFSMINCSLINNKKGVELRTRNWKGPTIVKLCENIFINNTELTLDIMVPNIGYYTHKKDTRTIDIGFNYFENSADIVLHTMTKMNLTFHDNMLVNCKRYSPNYKCIMHVVAQSDYEYVYRTFAVISNLFVENDAECVIYLGSSTFDINGTIFFNRFLSSKAQTSVIVINTHHFQFSQNIFDNPESPYDLYVTKQADGTIAAVNNWWGTTNTDLVFRRIFDFYKDQTLLSVNATPFLMNQMFDCSVVKNCSGNGECTGPGRCRCEHGWAGRSCDEYYYVDVSNCSQNGRCMGLNRCECGNCWTGQSCIHDICKNLPSALADTHVATDKTYTASKAMMTPTALPDKSETTSGDETPMTLAGMSQPTTSIDVDNVSAMSIASSSQHTASDDIGKKPTTSTKDGDRTTTRTEIGKPTTILSAAAIRYTKSTGVGKERTMLPAGITRHTVTDVDKDITIPLIGGNQTTTSACVDIETTIAPTDAYQTTRTDIDKETIIPSADDNQPTTEVDEVIIISPVGKTQPTIADVDKQTSMGPARSAEYNTRTDVEKETSLATVGAKRSTTTDVENGVTMSPEYFTHSTARTNVDKKTHVATTKPQIAFTMITTATDAATVLPGKTETSRITGDIASKPSTVDAVVKHLGQKTTSVMTTVEDKGSKTNTATPLTSSERSSPPPYFKSEILTTHTAEKTLTPLVYYVADGESTGQALEQTTREFVTKDDLSAKSAETNTDAETTSMPKLAIAAAVLGASLLVAFVIATVAFIFGSRKQQASEKSQGKEKVYSLGNTKQESSKCNKMSSTKRFKKDLTRSSKVYPEKTTNRVSAKCGKVSPQTTSSRESTRRSVVIVGPLENTSNVHVSGNTGKLPSGSLSKGSSNRNKVHPFIDNGE